MSGCSVGMVGITHRFFSPVKTVGSISQDAKYMAQLAKFYGFGSTSWCWIHIKFGQLSLVETGKGDLKKGRFPGGVLLFYEVALDT